MDKRLLADSILFSADPKLVNIADAIAHLRMKEKLYFEVKFPILKTHLSFPIAGFIHICKDKVRYVACIEDIIPFSRDHYENPVLAKAVKPLQWLMEWQKNINNIRFDSWKNALVITDIIPFEYDTYAVQRYTGEPVTHPPQNYIRVLPPPKWAGFKSAMISGEIRKPEKPS